jgi:hypothetical protein
MSTFVLSVFESEDLADLASGRIRRAVPGIRGVRVRKNRYASPAGPGSEYDWDMPVYPVAAQNLTTYPAGMPAVSPFGIHAGAWNGIETTRREDVLLEVETEEYSAESVARLLRSVGGRQIRIRHTK